MEILHRKNPVLWCMEAIRFSEYCHNYWKSTVKKIQFVECI